jgi:hypothetical protein
MTLTDKYPICHCGERYEVRRTYTVDAYAHIVAGGESQGITSTPIIDQYDLGCIEIQCSACGGEPSEAGHIIEVNPLNVLWPVVVRKANPDYMATASID